MKKTYLLLLAMGMIFALAQCKKKEDTPQPTPQPTQSVKNFFTVTNATFYDAAMPATSQSSNAPVITEVTGNGSIIDGGNNMLQIHSNSDDITNIIVAKKGAHGYYKLNTDSKKGLFQALLVFTSNISEDEFTIMVSIVNGQDLVSAYYEVLVKKVQNVGAGILQFSLSFDLLNDIDLHVVQPDNKEIFYDNPGGYDYYALYQAAQGTLTEEQLIHLMSLDNQADQVAYLSQFIAVEEYKTPGGWLDIDSNAGCAIDSVNNENINYNYASDILAGEYIVRVDFYSECVGGEAPTNYVVTAKYNGQIIATTSGANPYQGFFESGTADYGDYGAGVEVMRVNITPAMLSNNTKPAYQFTYDKDNVVKSNRKVNITQPVFNLNKWLKKAN